jgi:deoxyhypusine synthase
VIGHRIREIAPDAGDIELRIARIIRIYDLGNGALSSCPAGEGHTWGKVSAESVAAGSVYVHADVTAVFPWLTYALLSDPKMKKKPLDLVGARGAAKERLMREIAKRRADLVPTLSYPLPQS